MQKGMGIQFRFLDFYLDPFCFSALALPLFVLERKMLFKQTNISKLELYILVLFLIIFSEVILPYFFSQFVADVTDVFAIVLGGLWYSWFGAESRVKD
jgi:hypothetical protein